MRTWLTVLFVLFISIAAEQRKTVLFEVFTATW